MILNPFKLEKFERSKLSQYQELIHHLRYTYNNPQMKFADMPVIPLLDPAFDIYNHFKIKAPLHMLGSVVRVYGQLDQDLYGNECTVFFEGGYVEYRNEMLQHTPSLYVPTTLLFYGAVDSEFNEIYASIPYRRVFRYNVEFEWDDEECMSGAKVYEKEVPPAHIDMSNYWSTIRKIESGDPIENFHLSRVMVPNPFADSK